MDENGNPVLNFSHVLTCLNKVRGVASSLPSLIIICNLTTQLDAGTEEKIMLVARDEQSCLVVSYKDIKQCIESAFVYVFSLLFMHRV